MKASYSSVVMGAAGSIKEKYESSEYSVDAVDITITECIAQTSTVEPAVGFTLLAKDRHMLGRPTQQPCVTTLASDIRETTAIPTQNRFEVIGDRETPEIALRVVKPPTVPRKVDVGTFDPETSDTVMRAYLRRHVIEHEMEITDIQKLRPQSRTTVIASPWIPLEHAMLCLTRKHDRQV